MSVSLRRKTIAPYSFTDGLSVKVGDVACIPMRAIMSDESNYRNATTFDGYHFVENSQRVSVANSPMLKQNSLNEDSAGVLGKTFLSLSEALSKPIRWFSFPAQEHSTQRTSKTRSSHTSSWTMTSGSRTTMRVWTKSSLGVLPWFRTWVRSCSFENVKCRLDAVHIHQQWLFKVGLIAFIKSTGPVKSFQDHRD